MEEIISATATLQGSKIQANAALVGALLGFLGVILTLIGTWFTVLRSGKISRLAELRRVIYLDTIEAYSEMLAEFAMLSKNPLELKDNLFLKVVRFGSALDKTMFVCETKTKEAIVEFYEIYIPELKNFSKEVFPFIDAYEDLRDEEKRHQDLMDQFQKFYLQIDELKIENPKSDKFQNIFNVLDSKINYSSKVVEKIEEKESIYNNLEQKVSSVAASFIDKLNEKSSEVMYLLRMEIDINNNKELDKKLNERLKKLNK